MNLIAARLRHRREEQAELRYIKDQCLRESAMHVEFVQRVRTH